MKQTILLLIVSAFLCSCCSTKEMPSVSADTTYLSDPYVAKYKNIQGFTPPADALQYIQEFKNHQYRTFVTKKALKNSWSIFDQDAIKALLADDNTDSVFFYLAAFPKTCAISKKLRKKPFVMLQARKKSPVSGKGKGSAPKSGISVYLVPVDICPPPKTGCRVIYEN